MGTLGPIFGILFYLLVVFAAISSSISRRGGKAVSNTSSTV